MTRNARDWVAHAPRVLVTASRRNKLSLDFHLTRRADTQGKVRDREDALATQNLRPGCKDRQHAATNQTI
jgi:hypothetical protein